MTAPLPQKILCLCTENTVRSIMLEAMLSQYTSIESAGIDPVSFANPITQEVINNNNFQFVVEDPKGMDEISLEGVDLVIAVSEPAYQYFKAHNEAHIPLEYWTTATPPLLGEISRNACVAAYQNIFDELNEQMENSFKL